MDKAVVRDDGCQAIGHTPIHADKVLTAVLPLFGEVSSDIMKRRTEGGQLSKVGTLSSVVPFPNLTE